MIHIKHNSNVDGAGICGDNANTGYWTVDFLLEHPIGKYRAICPKCLQQVICTFKTMKKEK